MGLYKLETLDTYEQINGGAHRKPASIVGTPSLVRRIGFWNTGFGSGKAISRTARVATSYDRGKRNPAARIAAYQKYVAELARILRQAEGNNVHFDEEKELVQESDPVPQSGTVTIFRFWWHGIRTTVRLEFHTEYITLTSILDLSVKANRKYVRGHADLQARLEQAFQLLGKLFTRPSPKTNARYRRAGYFQDTVWEEFEKTLLNGKIGRRRILERAFGQVFADFRGIVTGSQVPTGEGWVSDSRVPKELLPLFREELPRRRDRPLRHEAPPAEWAMDTITRLWPLMEAHEFLRDFEFTAGGFLHGRVIYVSALGPQTLENENETWPWEPVYYYLHAYTNDEWQIGRLVDRINTLGTLRLASTMEMKSLVEAGKIADELANDIDDAANFLQRAIKDTKSVPATSAWWVGRPKRLGKTPMEKADERMVRVQSKLKDIDALVSGNIEYRLERSHYYLEQFIKEAKGLREDRIEGYQKYQEFVMRRMSGVFGYVELMRTRMSAIYSAIGGLGRQYASLKIASVTCSIDGLVAMTMLQHQDMETQEREIRKIQEFGEVALIGFLIPYYVGTSVIHHLLELEGLGARILWFITLGSCALLLLKRLRKQSAEDAEAAARLRPIRKVVRVYFGVICAGFAFAMIPEKFWHDAGHFFIDHSSVINQIVHQFSG